MESKLLNLKTIKWILRIGTGLTFLGHGIFAIKGNVKWLKYLEWIGFSLENAEKLIVMIGILDVLIATIVIFKPYKYVVLWAFIWAFSTALIRPLSGESIWQFIERASNWAVPLALFFLLRIKSNN